MDFGINANFDPWNYLQSFYYDPTYRDPRRNFYEWERKFIWKRDNGICGLCKKRVNLKKTNGKWHCDHIIPWILGGPTIVENGQVTHSLCNQMKYNDPNYEAAKWNRNWRTWWELIRK